jgi:hypothetical protein
VSLDALVKCCRCKGVYSNPVRVKSVRVPDLGRPAILAVSGSHYIALLGTDGDRLIFFDNSVGLVESTQDWFAEHYHWDGVALIVGFPSPSFVLQAYGTTIILVTSGCVLLFLSCRLIKRNANASG